MFSFAHMMPTSLVRVSDVLAEVLFFILSLSCLVGPIREFG